MAPAYSSIAFIGLGVTGWPMAMKLRSEMDSSKTLYIRDVSEDAINRFRTELAGKGPIGVVKNGHEAPMAADVVLSMLPNGPTVKKVYLDPTSGILAGVRTAATKSTTKKMIVECGTIKIAMVLEVSRATKETASFLGSDSSLKFVDAPVSGGPMGAQAGTLAFMVGTTKDVFAKLKEVLTSMANPHSVFLCGEVGTGTAFKALNIGVKLSYDERTLTDVINASGGQCWVTSKSNPVPDVQANVPSSRNYEGGLRIELCKKVLGMGIELAKDAGARTILDQPTMKAFEEAAVDDRYEGKDARVVYIWLNKSSE